MILIDDTDEKNPHHQTKENGKTHQRPYRKKEFSVCSKNHPTRI
jgi:hypothetical protein